MRHTNMPKSAHPVKEVSTSVLEARLRRAVRPKDRLWATIRLAEELMAAQTKRAQTLFAEAERLAEDANDRRGIATAIHGVGSCQLQLSNYATALESLERALPIAEQTGYAECEIKILRDIGHVYMRQGYPDRALMTLQKCVELAGLIGNRHVEASALNLMGRTLMHLGRYPESLEYHTKSLAFFDHNGTAHDQANTLLLLSNTLLYLGRYTEALSALHQSNEMSRGNARMERLCQLGFGVVYSEIGDYPKALSYLLASVTLLKSAGDKQNLAFAYASLTDVYRSLGNTEQTVELVEKAIIAFEEIGDKRGQAAMCENLSELYLARGQRTQAKRSLKQYLALSKEVSSKDFETTALTKLAEIEAGLGKFPMAEKLYQGALTIASESRDPDRTITALLGLGSLFNKWSKPEQSVPFLDRAVEIAREIHSRRHEQETHQMFSEALESLGDFERALEHSKLATSIKEEILGTEKQKAITELQIRSDIEKSEHETELLRKEVESREREIERMSVTTEQIAMAIAEKNELIGTVSRRVRKILRQTGSGIRGPGSGKLNLWISDPGPRVPELGQEYQLIHQDFLEMLLGHYPTLTPTERKICVLLREQFSLKEMSGLLKISTGVIGRHRYHIRKKMKLARGVNLTTVLGAM
jgi:tetratricopeptide (TPR) repeat protein/DNA-binding CsgD family transcriptional regulator